jgi:hypothetical protein
MRRSILAAALTGVFLAGGAQAAPDSLMGDFGPVVKWLRVYSGSDGKSHIEEMPVPVERGPYGMSVLFARNADKVTIGYWPDGFVSEWHYAVHRNVILYLQGVQYIDLGDGKEHRLESGVAVYAEDWTGQGHRFRCEAKTGKHACVAIQVSLGELERRLPLEAPR